MPAWSKMSPDQQKRRLDEIIRRKLRQPTTVVAASVPIASRGALAAATGWDAPNRAGPSLDRGTTKSQ
jgi:hypothetical protein